MILLKFKLEGLLKYILFLKSFCNDGCSVQKTEYKLGMKVFSNKKSFSVIKFLFKLKLLHFLICQTFVLVLWNFENIKNENIIYMTINNNQSIKFSLMQNIILQIIIAQLIIIVNLPNIGSMVHIVNLILNNYFSVLDDYNYF